MARQYCILTSMKSTEIAAILNYTPDSFSDGGLHNTPEKAIAYVEEAFNEGAYLVDIGAESTRPGATALTPETEYERLQPLIEPVIRAYSGHISIDTHHHQTVRRIAAEIGQFIINDVTGFNDPLMIKAAAELQLPVIVSHLTHELGQDIQAGHADKNKVDSPQQVVDELSIRIEELVAKGVPREFIRVDPGIGFNKTMRLNYELVRFAELMPDYPVMIGYSRKSFLYHDPQTGKLIPEFAELKDRATVPGASRETIGLHKAFLDQKHRELAIQAAQSGAALLRVHDVADHRRYLNSIQARSSD